MQVHDWIAQLAAVFRSFQSTAPLSLTSNHQLNLLRWRFALEKSLCLPILKSKAYMRESLCIPVWMEWRVHAGELGLHLQEHHHLQVDL
jgi:hypothetical protein